MYAVRIHPNKVKKYSNKRGYVWVESSTNEHYVTIKDRGIFETVEEAEKAKTENCEIIVKI